MPVIGLSFNSVEAKRSKETVKAEIKVNSTPTVKTVKEMNVPTLGGKKALSFEFEFLTKYDPEVAEIKMGGSIIYLSDKSASILKQWKKDKKIPEDVSIEILNHLFETHAEIRELFRFIEDQGEKFDPQQVIASIQDPTIASTISNAISTAKLTSNCWQYVRDCLVVIKLSQVDEQINKIRKKLSPQNVDQPQDLLQKYKELQEERKSIERGDFIVE